MKRFTLVAASLLSASSFIGAIIAEDHASDPTQVPLDLFKAPAGLGVTVWAPYADAA